MHECPHGQMSCFYLISFLPNNVSMHCKFIWVKHEMIQTWGFCYILWFKKLDYNPTQHLYTWAQNRVLTLRWWKSSTNLQIFKIQLAKQTSKNKKGRLRMISTQFFPRLDGRVTAFWATPFPYPWRFGHPRWGMGDAQNADRFDFA